MGTSIAAACDATSSQIGVLVVIPQGLCDQQVRAALARNAQVAGRGLTIDGA